MKCQEPLLSIVTPVYNRAQLLNNCYTSLCAQSSFDFEWIIVNDGSTDDTGIEGKRIRDGETRFPVVYIQKENGGKHTALNAAHPYVRGKYVLILDSDDTLIPEAVETIARYWKKYEQNPDIGMLIFLRCNSQGSLLAYVKDENTPVNFLSYKRISAISSDCCEVIRSNIFLRYPFPVFEGERFLAETALWYRAGLDCKVIYINKAIYVCEYLAGGLSQSGRSMRLRNPQGGKYTSYLRMNKECRLQERVRAGLLYVVYGCFTGDKAGKMLQECRPYGLLVAMCLLPGKIIYHLWRKQYL